MTRKSTLRVTFAIALGFFASDFCGFLIWYYSTIHKPAGLPAAVQNDLWRSLITFVTMCLNNCVQGTDNLNLPVNSLTPEFEMTDSCDCVNVNSTLHCDQNSLSCVQLNVRGITSKKTEVRYLIDNCLYNDKPDVLLLCETWLTPFSPILKIPGYETFQCNRTAKKGGGVAILLADKYRCKILDVQFISQEFESIFVKLELRNGECVCLGSIYRPPNTNPVKFIEEYCSVVSQN